MFDSKLLVLVICFNRIYCDANRRDKYVNTEYGRVRGQLAMDGDYLAFLGIPYAAAPIGEYRFQAPRPPTPWEGVLDATRTVRCPQSGEGDEDCLILNIFTPSKPFRKLLPVLVHIHGGFFRTGSGPIRGMERLTNQNIIVVTINYRLSALGFLCFGIKDAPGNAGLKDQVAALKWIQNNIFSFGGNPKEVTVHGFSTGSSSVEYLMLSKMANGLFRSAIMESGSATSVFASDANPIATALNVANLLNFSKDSYLKELAEEYITVSAEKLSLASEKYFKHLFDGTTGFVPCVEIRLNGVEPFMERSPHDILASGDYEQKPLLVIFDTLEGLFLRSEEYYSLNYKDRLESEFDEFLPADLTFKNEGLKKKIARKINQFYFGLRPIRDDTIIEYLNYFGDTLVMHSLFNSVAIHAKNQNPVYLMEFAYRGGMGSTDKFYESLNMAGHGDAMKHVFLENPIRSQMDRITVERMTLLFANFVKHGNPTPVQTSLNPVIWPQIMPSTNFSTLFLNYDYHVIHRSPYFIRKWFWDDVYQKYRKPVKPVDPTRYTPTKTTVSVNTSYKIMYFE